MGWARSVAATAHDRAHASAAPAEATAAVAPTRAAVAAMRAALVRHVASAPRPPTTGSASAAPSAVHASREPSSRARPRSRRHSSGRGAEARRRWTAQPRRVARRRARQEDGQQMGRSACGPSLAASAGAARQAAAGSVRSDDPAYALWRRCGARSAPHARVARRLTSRRVVGWWLCVRELTKSRTLRDEVVWDEQLANRQKDEIDDARGNSKRSLRSRAMLLPQVDFQLHAL